MTLREYNLERIVALEYQIITLLILASIVISCFLFIIIKVYISERNRKKYIPKVGDKVYYTSSDGVNCNITEILDDKVRVEMIVSKSRIYPLK